MTEWTQRTLGDVVELQRGHDLPTNIRTDGKVPIIGSFGVTGSHDTAIYDGPGVAIGRSGASIGRATFVAEPFWPLNTCLFVRDFKGNEPRWVYHLFQTTDFTYFNSGSAQPSLNRNYLKHIPVIVPPLPEQRGISEVLGPLDDKIAANTKLAVTATELMQALLAGQAPSVALGDVVEHHKEVVDLATLSNAAVAHYSLPAFDDGQVPEIATPIEIKSAKYAIQNTSVLVSKLNPRFPRVWDVLRLPAEPALASTEYVVLESRYASSTVLWAVLSQPSFSASLQAKVAGTSGSHQRVRPADLLATQVVDPRGVDGVLQEQITDLGRRVALSRKESVTLATVRDALLPQLMSGKLRVKDAEETAEEVLSSDGN